MVQHITLHGSPKHFVTILGTCSLARAHVVPYCTQSRALFIISSSDSFSISAREPTFGGRCCINPVKKSIFPFPRVGVSIRDFVASSQLPFQNPLISSRNKAVLISIFSNGVYFRGKIQSSFRVDWYFRFSHNGPR